MAQRGPARRLGVGPTSTSFSSWKLGLPSRTLPKRMEVPSPAGCTILREEPGPRPPPRLGAVLLPVLYSKRTFPHHRRGLGQRGGGRVPRWWWGLGLPSCFSGFPMRRVPLPHPRVSLSEAKLRAGECQHRRHSTWLVVPAGDPSMLGSSVLFTTPWRSRANTAFPPHGPVTSSPCLNSRWANRWR